VFERRDDGRAATPPDLDCANVPFGSFRVLPPDSHGFDSDHDGIACEKK